jgi:hypothetical protein
MTRLENKKFGADWTRFLLVAVTTAVWITSGAARAAVNGVEGQSFGLYAEEGYISVSDGGSIYSWGYTNTGTMQLPGPTLIVTEDQLVTITLTNNLPAAAGNVSIVFPGQNVTASGGVPGDLVREAENGGTVTYTFRPSEPGTYQYHSGTEPDLQVEMGLYGALIVRPANADTTSPSSCTRPVIDGGGKAYDHPDACYDREYLYVLSEIDIHIHQDAEAQASGPGPIVLPSGAYDSEYWLMNGRAGPDSMAPDGTEILPYQPYGSLTRMHPGERVLVRVVGAGREMHPFHTHGNHARLLARDGRMLLTETSNQLAGPLLFTIPSLPGGTADGIFEWTGKELGWDIYEAGNGHTCTDDVNNTTGVAVSDGYADAGSDYPWEWCPDHDKPIPVTLPSLSSLAFGGFYGGSPYLGAMGSLPPGEGGLNPWSGFAYMWHSHTERELVNNDVFPGGMMTMLIVEEPGAPIDCGGTAGAGATPCPSP